MVKRDNNDLGSKAKASKTIIEFDDFYGEWLIPIQIAKQHNEPPPLIVCSSIEIPTVPIKLGEYHTRPWFVPLIQRLTLRDEFSLAFGKYTRYIKIYQITDLAAYHLIWSRLNTNSLVDYVFAADCNIEKLKRMLKIAYQQQTYRPDIKELKLLASWCYWQQHGGGDGEHFACYYSHNSKYIELFEHYLDADHFKKRYHQVSSWTGRIKEANFFLDLKLTYQYQQGCYFVFQKELPSLLDIKTKAQYHAYFSNYMECDDWDFQETVNMYYYLKPALSIPAIAEFTHLGVFYKVIEIQNIDILKRLLTDGILEDFILGFFSLDTNPQELKTQILQNKACMMPESLLNLGEWAMVRRIENCDDWPCAIATNNPEDLGAYILRKKRATTLTMRLTQPLFFLIS